MSHPPDLYPDLAEAGGLALCLEETFHKIGSLLHVAKRTPGRNYARVELGQRFSQVYIALDERLFLYDFWNRGVMLANASTPDIVVVARSIHRWVADGVTTTQLRNEFSFVKPDASAAAFESGNEVESCWAGYEKAIPKRFPDLADFFEVARQTPELWQLFPYTSLNCFCFSRCTGYPYSYDCPVVIPKGKIGSGKLKQYWYEVRLGEKLLGEGNGPEAVRLVIENLPDGCGPAVAGTADELCG